MRHLPDLRAGGRRRGGAGDERVLIGVTAGDAPGRRQLSVRTQLVAVRSLAPGLDDAGRIVGIRRPRVGAVQPVHRGRQGQPGTRVPLHARLVVVEPFRFDLLGNGRERRELVAGARQIRHAVAAVQREGRDGLDDHAGARRHEIVRPREVVARAIVVIQEIEAIEPQSADQLQMARELDLILHVGRAPGSVRR